MISNGVISVEGLLSNNDFCSEDKRTIEEFVRNMGFSYYMTCHYKNGKKIMVKNMIKELEVI
jgi:hypothetical protein